MRATQPAGAAVAAQQGLPSHAGRPLEGATDASRARTRGGWGGWGEAGVLGIVYASLAWASIYLSRLPDEIAHVWYANAVAAAYLARLAPRDWGPAGVALAVAIAAVNVVWGDRIDTALAFTVPNLAEIVLAALLMRQAGLHDRVTTSVGPLLQLLVRGAVLPQLAGAFIGAALLAGRGAGAYWEVWQSWLEGSLLGAVSMLPLAHEALCLGRRALLQRLLRWEVLALMAFGVGTAVLALAQVPFPFVYLTVPLLLAAVVLEFTAVAALTLAASVTVAVCLATGVFVSPPLLHRWQEVFVYLAWAAALLPALLLGAAVADLRASRESLARHSSELDRANQGLEQFVRILSHDLREPLNTITQFSGLVRSDHRDGLHPEAAQYLGLVERAAVRMRALLDDLLAYTRLARRLGPDGGTTVPLHEVVAEAQQALAARLRERGALVEVGVLPPVRGHAAPLALLFQNLIGNAVKFVPPGQVPVVKVSAERQGAWVVVRVADNGIGIAEADQARLFQPFVRLNPRHHFEGTGLGLALVRQVAEAHGGSVSVHSAAGQGSTFIVRLPAAEG